MMIVKIRAAVFTLREELHEQDHGDEDEEREEDDDDYPAVARSGDLAVQALIQHFEIINILLGV